MVLIGCVDDIELYMFFEYNIDASNEIIDQDVKKRSVIFLLTSWYKSSRVKHIVNKNKEYNIVVLANSEEEKEYFQTVVKCDVLYCNHNAFLNENVFKIVNNIGIYDLVVDSCFSSYKNTNISNKNSNTKARFT